VTPAIAGVIAICPAGEEMLIRGLRAGRFEMRVDRDAVAAWMSEHDLREAVELMGPKPLILLQADGDDRVPAAWTRELAERAHEPKRLIVVPGGHHGSVQHDEELNGVALEWLARRV
jgi:pimeloyl-ACP methyl ester carboxylesterase